MIDARVLGQLLVMQSIMINLQDKNSIFSFVCKGLMDIPGIYRVDFFADEYNMPENDGDFLSYPIETSHSKYGKLIIKLSGIELYKPYEEYLKNFVFMIGIILEERNQRQINHQHQRLLEERILARTMELTGEKEQLSIITDHIPVFISHFNREFEFLFVNKPYFDLYGTDPETIIGKKAADIMGAELFGIAFPYMNQALNGEIVHHEHKFTGKDGHTNYLYSTYVPHLNNNEVSGFFVLAWDITELKQNELNLKLQNEEFQSLNEEYAALNEELSNSYEHLVKANAELEIAKHKAEENDKLKTAFLQNMSHEIRTPLNAIMGFAEIMVNYFNDKEKLEKFTDIIKQRGEDLLIIINDILDIARLESGQLQLHYNDFKIAPFFEELSLYFNLYMKKLDKQNLLFQTNLHHVIDNIHITTDQSKLRQIFVNLLSNAFKFTESGKIEAGCFYDTDNQLVFYVSDTGIGIPVEKHHAVFERFVQVEYNASRRYGGAGLGLAIVKELLSLLGGKIWIVSEPGKGSTFNFTIPLNTGNKPYTDPTEKLEKLEKMNPGYRQTTILIVEDDYYNAEFLKEVLLEEGFILLYAKNGGESIEIATSKQVDIILMDIRLPDMNGYEAVQIIRRQKPHIKIIAQTAYASAAEEHKAKDSGCDDYISKPINRLLMLTKIRKLMSLD